MQTAKEKAANVAASAKSGMEKTKAVVQEKAEKMTTRDPLQKEMATQKKEDRIHQAEMEKQAAMEQNAASKQAAALGGTPAYTATAPAHTMPGTHGTGMTTGTYGTDTGMTTGTNMPGTHGTGMGTHRTGMTTGTHGTGTGMTTGTHMPGTHGTGMGTHGAGMTTGTHMPGTHGTGMTTGTHGTDTGMTTGGHVVEEQPIETITIETQYPTETITGIGGSTVQGPDTRGRHGSGTGSTF